MRGWPLIAIARRAVSSYYANKKESILAHNLPDISLPPIPTPSQLISGNDGIGPTIIDGKATAKEIRSGISKEVQFMKETINMAPGLAVILIGQRRDSHTFVRCKIKACEQVGINSHVTELPADCTENEVLNAISSFNKDPSVHGILVQLPLPQHLNEMNICDAISLHKDVDGFHPINMGNLALRGRDPLVIPCAARACIELLIRSSVELKGKNVAVIGQSKIAGLPTSLLLQRHLATVTSIHASTRNPENITRQADIVISTAGVANLVRGSWLKKGAIVIDVGTNPVQDKSFNNGHYITGDVCYEEALQVVSAITPVPGGVGPVTISMLLMNILESAKRAYGLS